MQLISFTFFVFWGILFFLYYKSPKIQWQLLLIASFVFYWICAGKLPFVLIGCTSIAYIYGRLLKKGLCSVVYLWGCIGLQLLLLIMCRSFNNLGYGATLGVSFFVLSAIGYCVDIHREKYPAEHSFFKLLLGISFFPSIIQGPINRYDMLSEQLFHQHDFSWDHLYKGIQRFVWGTMKILVIVPRLGIIVNEVYANLPEAEGFAVMAGTACFAIQLYADFSGYMDMVTGVGETFGIKITENFNRPFFSASVSEFWRRWHISLGTWFKDYVLYSIVMSNVGRKINKRVKRYNKQYGKIASTLLGTMIVWVLTGLWHSNSKGYLIWGIYYGILMCCSLARESRQGKKEKGRYQQTRIYRLFCIARTWCIVLIADVFIETDSFGAAMKCIGKLFRIDQYQIGNVFRIVRASSFVRTDTVVLAIALLLWFLVSILQEKGYGIREWISKQRLPVRWMIWYALVFAVIWYGKYGAEYDVSVFMYQGY